MCNCFLKLSKLTINPLFTQNLKILMWKMVTLTALVVLTMYAPVCTCILKPLPQRLFDGGPMVVRFWHSKAVVLLLLTCS